LGSAGERTLHGHAHSRPGPPARRARRDGHRHLPERPGPASRHRALRAVRRDHDPLRPARLTPVRRPPAARPRHAVKRPQTPLRSCCIRCHLAVHTWPCGGVNRLEPDARPDRGIAAKPAGWPRSKHNRSRCCSTSLAACAAGCHFHCGSAELASRHDLAVGPPRRAVVSLKSWREAT
jgi:hypothetical protein